MVTVLAEPTGLFSGLLVLVPALVLELAYAA
jgi:hypothetical protein